MVTAGEARVMVVNKTIFIFEVRSAYNENQLGVINFIHNLMTQLFLTHPMPTLPTRNFCPQDEKEDFNKKQTTDEAHFSVPDGTGEDDAMNEDLIIKFNTVDLREPRDGIAGKYHKMLENDAGPAILNNFPYVLDKGKAQINKEVNKALMDQKK